jgi:hypothetical protein
MAIDESKFNAPATRGDVALNEVYTLAALRSIVSFLIDIADKGNPDHFSKIQEASELINKLDQDFERLTGWDEA